MSGKGRVLPLGAITLEYKVASQVLDELAEAKSHAQKVMHTLCHLGRNKDARKLVPHIGEHLSEGQACLAKTIGELDSLLVDWRQYRNSVELFHTRARKLFSEWSLSVDAVQKAQEESPEFVPEGDESDDSSPPVRPPSKRRRNAKR